MTSEALQTRPARARPSALDVLDLALLRLGKTGRRRLDAAAPFYDDFFAVHDLAKYQRDVRNAWRFRRVAAELARLDASGAATVLDIGCGLGLLARYLPDETRYVGLDLSPATLRKAEEVVRLPHARFALGSFPELPVEDESVDVAACLEVLEHLADDEQAVRELARIVRPGGHLFVSVPQTYYWRSYLELIGHYRHYRGDVLADLLERGGFEVVRRYPMLAGLWRLHHYAYVVLRAWEWARRRFGASGYSLYDSPAYRALAARVTAAAAAREAEDCPQSTFVLARRTGGTA